MPERQFLSIGKVAAILGVSRWTVSRMLDDGVFPRVSVRGAPRIDRIDLEAWIVAEKAKSAQSIEERRKKTKRPVGRPRKAGLNRSKSAAGGQYMSDDRHAE